MIEVKIGSGSSLELHLDGEVVAIIVNSEKQVELAKMFAASEDVLSCLIKSEKAIENNLRYVLKSIDDTPEGIEYSVKNSPLLNEIRSAIRKSTD